MRAPNFPKRGFSLVELMIVVTITGLMALLAAPRFTNLMNRNALRSSRQQIESMIATARAAAIQKGYSATFKVSGAKQLSVTAVINDAGATTTLIPPFRLDSIHKGMSLEVSGDTLIVFSARGYASPRLTAPGTKFRLTIGGKKDSTCVSTVGHILGQSCSL